MIVEVNTLLATICFLGQCYPALVGEDTLSGTYDLQKRIVISEGYGGNVLAYRETKDKIFAVHRVWKDPNKDREFILNNKNSTQRRFTNGCINVSYDVYDKLLKKWSTVTLVVK